MNPGPLKSRWCKKERIDLVKWPVLVLLIHHRASPFFPPSGRDCPLLHVLAGKAAGEEEGSLPWIISWLLEGNSYSSLLLRLEPQGGEGGWASLESPRIW